ncbi:MAG TPA: hypothetical protein VLG47_01135 [Candidatus Saccharimonadales bacterium]|nr:hypothetical protein [Candidatus Saccharimonadales bacterium]
MATTNKNVIPQKKLPQSVKWSAVVIIVLIVGFLVYSFLSFGGVGGFWLAHQQFPGADAPALQSGRMQAEQGINSATSQLAALKGAGYVTVLPQQYQDLCEKGEHSLGIAGATEDNYAYSCGLETKTIFAYSESECTVAQALLDSHIRFGSLTKDCPQEESPQNVGGNLGVDKMGSDLVSIDTKSHYLKFFEIGVDSILKCYSPRVKVYCNTKNIDGQSVKSSLATIPANAQTIVVHSANAPYYAK